MKQMIKAKLSAFAAVVLFIGLCAPLNAASDARMQFVGNLINNSSAAKRVESSGIEAAIAKREEAAELYQQAMDLKEEGKGDEATATLTQAIKTMQAAVKLAKPTEIKAEKDKKDYQGIRKSVVALLESHAAIAEEKDADDEVEEVGDAVAAEMEQADELVAEGKVVEGRKKLDHAYMILTASIEQMRAGDTLVRDLNFETPEEEYAYVAAQNADRRRLFVGFLEGREIAADKQPMVDKLVEVADYLRSEAETQADDGDYEEAMVNIHKSNKALVKAVRSSRLRLPSYVMMYMSVSR